MATLTQGISQIRRLLDNPEPQSPSAERIANELMAEYQNATNELNNTGNAWNVATATLNVRAGKSKYELDATDFSKPLSVYTLPQNAIAERQRSLEFIEIEHLPDKWRWLSGFGGCLWHSGSQYIAFYRRIEAGGETLYCEIRPAPQGNEQYEILYTVGDWSNRITVEMNLPLPAHREYFFSLCALNLLPYTRWTTDEAFNSVKRAEIKESLIGKVMRYGKTWKEFADSLVHSDVVSLTPYYDAVETGDFNW